MKSIELLAGFFFVVGLISVFLDACPAFAHSSDLHADTGLTATVGDVVSDNASLENFAEHAAAHLSEAQSFATTLELLNEFRNEGGEWNDGSTYLILLTRGNRHTGVGEGYSGGVYVHSKHRELEDLDWSNIRDAAGNDVGQQFLGEEGGFVEYYAEGESTPRQSYAFPFAAPFVPLSNPVATERKGFVLVGGFDYEPQVFSSPASFEELIEELFSELWSGSGEDRETNRELVHKIVNPELNARDVGGNQDLEQDKEELRQFVEEAFRFFTGAFVIPVFDPVISRRLFRFEGGPWRHISTYIYIMDDRGNVIFNGANRSIEQTNLWHHPEVGSAIQELIAVAQEPGGGFVEYNWDDPNVRGDEPSGGGAGGSSPKLGYAKAFPVDKPAKGEDSVANPRIYIFGSGLYLGEPSVQGDEGGCTITGAEDTLEDAVFNLLLVVSALFLAISFKWNLTERHKMSG